MWFRRYLFLHCSLKIESADSILKFIIEVFGNVLIMRDVLQ